MPFIYDINFISDQGLLWFWRKKELAKAEIALSAVQVVAKHYFNLQEKNVAPWSSVMATFEGFTVLPAVDNSNDWTQDRSREDAITQVVVQRGAVQFVKQYSITQATYTACYIANIGGGKHMCGIMGFQILFFCILLFFLFFGGLHEMDDMIEAKSLLNKEKEIVKSLIQLILK